MSVWHLQETLAHLQDQKEGLKILAEGARGIPTNTTTNIVYNEKFWQKVLAAFQQILLQKLYAMKSSILYRQFQLGNSYLGGHEHFIRPVVLTFCSTCVCEKNSVHSAMWTVYPTSIYLVSTFCCICWSPHFDVYTWVCWQRSLYLITYVCFIQLVCR